MFVCFFPTAVSLSSAFLDTHVSYKVPDSRFFFHDVNLFLWGGGGPDGNDPHHPSWHECVYWESSIILGKA